MESGTAGDLRLYREAAAAAFLWHFRLHPRSLSLSTEGVPQAAHGEIAFGAMVSHGPPPCPKGQRSKLPIGSGR